MEEIRKERNLGFSDRARTIKRALRPLNMKMHQKGKPEENRFICLGGILALICCCFPPVKVQQGLQCLGAAELFCLRLDMQRAF